MIHAIKHIHPMRGGSQAHMLADQNGSYWIVKFLNNPQHPRVLANEWIASSLARAIGLTVPDFENRDIPVEIGASRTKARRGFDETLRLA